MLYMRGFFLLLALFPSFVFGYDISGWTYGNAESLDAATDRAAIDEVATDWYLSLPNSALKGDGVDLAFVKKAHARNVRVLATISNYSNALNDFDPDIPSSILSSNTTLTKHVNAIVALCINRKFDGIDLDWEALHPADKDRFSSFVTSLANRLHQKNKILSIAIHAKTSEPGDWDGPKAEDWVALGKAVDEFKVMTYDFSGPFSKPGPIAPPNWINAVLNHAEALVDPSKIMMGLPFYGYDWSNSSADGIYWTQANSLISKYSPVLKRSASKEPTFRYTDGSGVPHVVFFQDRKSIEAKLNVLLQKHPSIRGVAIWVMGDEDPAFWDQIDLQLR